MRSSQARKGGLSSERPLCAAATTSCQLTKLYPRVDAAEMSSHLIVTLAYAVVGLVVIPIGFAVFKTAYRFPDILLAVLAGAALTAIPTAGGVLSLVATVAVLYWRLGGSVISDILVSVFVARLAMVPVFLLLQPR